MIGNLEISFGKIPKIDLKFVPFPFFLFRSDFNFYPGKILGKGKSQQNHLNVRYVEMSPVNSRDFTNAPFCRALSRHKCNFTRASEWPALALLRAATVADLHPLTLCLARPRI